MTRRVLCFLGMHCSHITHTEKGRGLHGPHGPVDDVLVVLRMCCHCACVRVDEREEPCE